MRLTTCWGLTCWNGWDEPRHISISLVLEMMNFVPLAVSLSLKNRCNTGMATKPSWKQGSAFSQESLKGYYQTVAQVGEIF